MTYKGFLSLGGVELVNAERTLAYVQNLLPEFPLRSLPEANSGRLRVALEDDPYESPVLDGADWVNINDPATHGFYGLYPLEIIGIGDSTRTAETTESILDGGSVGESRHATRSMKLRAMMIASDDLSLEAGMTWLRAAAETGTCGIHDGTCGQSDLRYFLALPEVCEEKWSATPSSPTTVNQGPLTPETSPLVYPNIFPESMPSSWQWTFDLVDGTVITWGRIERSGSRVMYESAPVLLQRTNFATNPTFAADTTGWAATTSTISRVGTGGSDGGAYGHLAENAPPAVRFNWAPDPGFNNTSVEASGWRLTNSTASIVAGTPKKARFVRGTDPVQSFEVSLFGKGTPVASALQFGLGATTAAVIVELFDNLGTLVSTLTIPSGSAAQTVKFQGTVGANYVLRLSTSQASVDISSLNVEAGAAYNASFSGSDATAGTTVYRYIGAPFVSPSRRQAGALTSHTLTLKAPDTRYGALSASFALKSDLLASVTASLVSLDDGTVLSTLTIPVGFDWTRYNLYTPYGRNVKLLFSGTGTYDIDQVLIEAGPTSQDYFDGSTPAPADYSVTWLGAPNLSYSRQSWTGNTLMESEGNDFRPFISSTNGSLPLVKMTYRTRAQISNFEQLEPYERAYHDVTVVSGPTILQELSLPRGAAREVEVLFTAGTPFAFSTSRQIDIGTPASARYSDPRPIDVNELTNPSFEVNLTGWVVEGPGATITRSTDRSFSGGASCFFASTSSVAEGGMYNSFTPISGSGWNAGDPFAVGAWVLGTVGAVISIAAATTGGPVTYVPYTIVPGWQFISATSYVGGTSTSIPYLVIVKSSSAPMTLYVDGTIISRGTSVTESWAGDTPANANFTYAWQGTPNASKSSRTRRAVILDPLVDPALPPVPNAPRVPPVSDVTLIERYDWLRYYIVIPASEVALWADTVVTATITSLFAALRQVRVRFHPNPFGYNPAAVDPLGYCGEFILSYIPQNTQLVVNGMTERASAIVAGNEPLPADHLLYGTGGTPMVWPELSCALDYVMTIDVPANVNLGSLIFDLTVNRKE